MVAIASTLMNVKKRFEYRIRNDSTKKEYRISIIVSNLHSFVDLPSTLIVSFVLVS